MAESVVDYMAWNKGYSPPSEHQLIHELSHGGARVVMSSTIKDKGFWLVTKNGELPSKKDKLLLWQMLDALLDEDEAPKAEPDQKGPPHD